MSLVTFDSTQFISFDLVADVFDYKTLLNNFREQGFNILVNEEINTKKSKYLQDYFSNYIVELFQDEFLGEFEDWKVKENAPDKILKFSETIQKIANSGYIKDLKIIFVEYAAENKEENHIFEKEISLENICDGLFYASKWCFEEWGNIMIFSIK